MTHVNGNNVLDVTMESVARICIAGFGGALAGLSLVRTRRLVFVRHHISCTLQHATTSATFAHTSVDSLPFMWAIKCSAFVGILEFNHLFSPMGIMLAVGERMNQYRHSTPESKSDSSNRSAKESFDATDTWRDCTYWNISSAVTICDYAIGGTFAGAIFSYYPTACGSRPELHFDSFLARPSEYPSIQHIRQKQTIGRGRILRSKTKDYASSTHAPAQTLPSSQLISYSEPSISKTQIKTIRSLHPPIIHNALAGFFLGLCAGVIQSVLDHVLTVVVDHPER